MKTVLMNMVRILDGDNVVVLDKKKKYGWEGLTFPGGKVDEFESFEESAIREVKEETNLDVLNLEFNGIIQWIHRDKKIREVGLLYTAKGFKGELISENREGKLSIENYEKFKTMQGHSYSMNYLLKIFDGTFFEICLEFDNNVLVNEKYI